VEVLSQARVRGRLRGLDRQSWLRVGHLCQLVDDLHTVSQSSHDSSYSQTAINKLEQPTRAKADENDASAKTTNLSFTSCDVDFDVLTPNLIVLSLSLSRGPHERQNRLTYCQNITFTSLVTVERTDTLRPSCPRLPG